MTKITVHNFVLPVFRTDSMEEAKGKATPEEIKRLHGEIIPHTEEVIDDSQLNHGGRYHEQSKTQA